MSLRVSLPRLGSPFTRVLDPHFEQWELQLAGMDPEVKEWLPVREPQPRANAVFYGNLSACEKAIRERRTLRFMYKKSFDSSIFRTPV